MPRHSREDALTEREFELLYQSISEMKSSKQLETKFIMMCAGRMGMRGGEIAHIRNEWIDTSTHTIEIPEHDPCQFGKFDDPCGYCRNRARDYMGTHNRSYSEVIDDVKQQYPHSLRATAAMLHASRDVSPYSLMSTMGWETLETARAYIGSSDTSAARELRFKYR